MAEQLAGELGVSVWSLKRWAQLYGQGSAAGGPPGWAAADAAAPRGRINSFDGRGKKWVSF